jgi:hypothetical protein
MERGLTSRLSSNPMHRTRMNWRYVLPILTSFATASCDVTQDRFGRTAEPGPAPEPLTLKEVSFHVRMGSVESEIVAEATRRGLIIEGNPQQELANIGASSSLIAKLATREILLTKGERKLYEQRLAARGSHRAMAEANAQEFLERRKATLNQSLADQQKVRARKRITELSEKARKIRAEQLRERYSLNRDSPYQRRQAEIDEINREITALKQQAR